MKTLYFFLLSFLCTLQLSIAQCPKLVWADEFTTTKIDDTKWGFQNGDGCDINLCGWGNNELEYYRPENATQADGILTITAKKENFMSRQYTSSKMRSIYKGDIKFGRIEARMKMPKGQGIWPAFWMLPTDNVYGAWPLSGELDILEYLGHQNQTIHGTLHFGQPWPNNQSTTQSFTTKGPGFDEDYHIYALEWSADDIKWFIDGYLYSTKNRNSLNGQPWPFDQRFYFILNMAVGGNWPGAPNFSTQFPQEFKIDYVRVYDMLNAPHLTGPRVIPASNRKATFTVKNNKAGATYKWKVPAGVNITKGDNTNEVEVQWSDKSGQIEVQVMDGCGTNDFKMYITAEQPIVRGIVLENFDLPAKMTRAFNTGAMTEDFANPSKTGVNTSNLVGKYVRNASEQYDVIVYKTNEITNAKDFTDGVKKLYVDIYSSHPGATILFQLENSSTATGGNYPSGRHSRYQAVTTKNNEWERIVIPFLDRPDGGLSDAIIDQIVILFSPGAFLNQTFYIDNIDIYQPGVEVATKDVVKKSGIKLSPNPAYDMLKVETDFKAHTIEVFDVSGRLVKVSKAENLLNKNQMDVSDLSKGAFVLRAIGENIESSIHFQKI
jgi:beta-glucanase (GH16 family)